MEVNTVAAATATFTAMGTIAATMMAASVASTVATIAYSILALTSAAVSIASITAWIHEDSKDADSYFNIMGDHIKYAIAGIFQLVAQILVQAVGKGLSDGVSTAIRRKISGPDITVKQEKA